MSPVQKVVVAAGEAAVAATMLNAELVREEHERWRRSEEPVIPATALASLLERAEERVEARAGVSG